jgi:hypothetical protein
MFEINNNMRDIPVPAVGSMHGVTSEKDLSSWALLVIRCLFPQFVVSLYLKMSVQNNLRT